MEAPGPVPRVAVLFNERGEAIFEKDPSVLTEDDIRAYESTVVRDCGQGYVIAPCTSREAKSMPFGGLALFCEEYGYCEYVPVIDIPEQSKHRIQLVDLQSPADALLLGARLHREHRLSHGAISHAVTLMVERASLAPNEKFLGLHRSKYPKLYRSVLALSPAQLRGQASLPCKTSQQAQLLP